MLLIILTTVLQEVGCDPSPWRLLSKSDVSLHVHARTAAPMFLRTGRPLHHKNPEASHAPYPIFSQVKEGAPSPRFGFARSPAPFTYVHGIVEFAGGGTQQPSVPFTLLLQVAPDTPVAAAQLPPKFGLLAAEHDHSIGHPRLGIEGHRTNRRTAMTWSRIRIAGTVTQHRARHVSHRCGY